MDHPRSRGVYVRAALGPAERRGSSPLARGLLSQCCVCVCLGGIIPARAGFTEDPHQEGPELRDHPRSRGVYRTFASRSANVPGSSPLARGLPLHEADDPEHGRIIPARAGFTGLVLEHRAAVRDHPRSRGVYSTSNMNPRNSTGSSPLARGLLKTHDAQHRKSPDHPRSRGVYAGRAGRR